MAEILAEFEDSDGTAYLVLSDPDEGGDLRNARGGQKGGKGGRGTRGRVVRVEDRDSSGRPGRPSRRPRDRDRDDDHDRGEPVRQQLQIIRADDSVTIKTGKVLKFLEVVSDGVAELIPLPDQPPEPTGQVDVDLRNQNEHRHALHAHRVLTSRVRASGRMMSKIFQLLLEG